MPRGTRAVHGTEVGHELHVHGQVYTLTAYCAAYEWLPVSCWCEAAFVWVTQREVAQYGVTRSCGAPGCADPRTGIAKRGDIIHRPSARLPWGVSNRRADPELTVEAIDYARGVGRDGKAVVRGARNRARVVVAEPRDDEQPTGLDREWRRDQVLAQWQDRKEIRNIARNVGVSVATVRNDIAWLRHRGLIGQRLRIGTGGRLVRF